MLSRSSYTLLSLIIVFSLGHVAEVGGQNVTGYEAIPEPLLFLVREPAVYSDLKLSQKQQAELVEFNRQFDAELLASRLWPAEKSERRFAEILASTRKHLQVNLDAKQQERLRRITYRIRGIGFVLLPEAAKVLNLTAAQQSEIEQTLESTRQQVAALRQEVVAGTRPSADADQLATDLRKKEQQEVFAQLTLEQQQSAIRLIGELFDVRQLGKVSFQSPEIVDTQTWINSQPLSLAKLKGHVVALHFWTFGCRNCIENYPWYQQWFNAYDGKGLVILGIHTPETSAERQLERVKAKVEEEEFRFPIVVDNESSNWKAWGNSMWPSVYLIDKRGRVRYWWYGELNWQGAGGQDIMAKRIEELMAEAG